MTGKPLLNPFISACLIDGWGYWCNKCAGFLKASFRVSVGTNDGESPAKSFHFGLPYRWVGVLVQ